MTKKLVFTFLFCRILFCDSLFAETDSIPINLKVYVAAVPFFYSSGKSIVASSFLFSVSQGKASFKTGVIYDTHVYYESDYAMGGSIKNDSRFQVLTIPIAFNFYFSERRLRPYLSAGFHYIKTFIVNGEVENSDIYCECNNPQKTLVFLSLGAEYFVSSKVSVYVESLIRTGPAPCLFIGASYNIARWY